MPREMLADGTYREVTWDEIRERSGEEAVRDLQTPAVPLSEMTEGQRALAERMQSEFELSAALRERGQTIDDVIPGFSLKPPEVAPAEAPAAERSAPAETSGAGPDTPEPPAGETGEDGR